MNKNKNNLYLKLIIFFGILIVIYFSSNKFNFFNLNHYEQSEIILIKEEEVNLKIGESKQLNLNILQPNTINKKIIWETSNPEIVKINTNTGFIEALNEGIATITIKYNNKIYDMAIVNVYSDKTTIIDVYPTKISIINSPNTLDIGDSIQLQLLFTPTETTKKGITWSSSDNSIISVNPNGEITALKEGIANIIAKSSNNLTTSVTIKVNKKIEEIIPNSINFEKNLYSVSVNKTITILPIITPHNSTNKKISWSSSDPNIATVDNNGKIKGIKVGKAIINATIGSLSTSCVIEVTNIAFTWDNGSEYLISNGAGAPRVYALTNGNLIAGFETIGSNNTLEIKTVISKDGGKTWLNKTTASFQPDKNCANINFYIYQNKLYMAYRATKESGEKYYTSLQVSISEDVGLTWKHHSTIIEYTNNNNNGVWEPYLGLLNGKLTCFYANDSRNVVSSYQNIEYLVWDGNSWGNRTIVSNGKKHLSRDGMPVWTKLSTGEYILIIESSKYSTKYPFVIQMIYSENGIDWSNPVDVYLPITEKSKAAAPGIIEITSTNQIVISFQTDENSNNKGDSYSVMKTIYSNITAKELINKIKTGKSITKDFSPPDNIFQTPNGKSTIWTGIHYKNGWLYASAGGKSSHQSGALLKKIYIG